MPVAWLSVHKPRQIHSDFRGYQRIRFRSLDRKKICLWSGDERLGLMRMSRVLREFLGPGKTLSWRPEALGEAVDGKVQGPVKADAEIWHYEIMSIAEPGEKLDPDSSRRTQEDGMRQVFFRSDLGLASTPPQTELADAYRHFGDPDNGARYPVKFHIHPPQDLSSPYTIKWAIKNRVDFHPNVIKRAMPEGVKFTIKPLMRKDYKEVFWYFAAKHYDAGPQSDENAEQNSSERVSKSTKQETADKSPKEDHLSEISGGLIRGIPSGRRRRKDRTEALLEGSMPEFRD